MVFDVSKIVGIDEFTMRKEPGRELYLKNGRAFLILNPHTIEMRCDLRLSQNLQEKYESVMESRYFGRGGIEVVPSEQLDQNELEDLVRLSYNLTE
ncbi:hypothetical protein IKG05_00770 [Candidatus Saccharibacteria bacterium]|nr:hypothetical protein [Candidatus Saccharibacteria bacterium]